jgi:hypothetical protein
MVTLFIYVASALMSGLAMTLTAPEAASNIHRVTTVQSNSGVMRVDNASTLLSTRDIVIWETLLAIENIIELEFVGM